MSRRSASSRSHEVAPWFVLVALLALACAPLVVPASGGSQFSVDRAMADVGVLATEPHPMGTAAIDEVRRAIIERLSDLGLEPDSQRIDVPDYFGSGAGTVPVINLAARIPGTASTGAVTVVAHYDTVPTTPGANDNSASVAVMLELARLLGAESDLRNDVILLFTDGEEPAPRFGSTAFVADHPWANEIGVVVNLEALGGGGASTLIAVTEPWLVAEYSTATPRPVAYSFLTRIVDLIGGSNTDIAPFRERGVPGLEMAYLRGSPAYHTPADNPESVGVRSLDHHGRNTLALVRHLADLDLARTPAGVDEVFFTVGWGTVLAYPVSWSVWGLAVAAGLLGLAVRRRWREGADARYRVFGAVGATVLDVVASMVVGGVAWLGITAIATTPGIAESYLYLIALVALVYLISVLMGRRTRRRRGAALDPLGVGIAWWLLAVSTAVLPGVGYLFACPALALAVSLEMGWVPSAVEGKRLAGFVLVTGTVLVLLVPAIDIFYQFAQPRPGNLDSQLLWMIVVPLWLTSLAVTSLRTMWPEAAGHGRQPPRRLV